jgi:hypothetical protein
VLPDRVVGSAPYIAWMAAMSCRRGVCANDIVPLVAIASAPVASLSK